MNAPLNMQALAVVSTIRPFLSVLQLACMADGCRGEEKDYFIQKFVDLAEQINTMPKTYEQDGKGDDAVAHLHYFLGGNDWFITEKDMDGGVQQAFGYAILNGDDEMAECGYISISELVRHGVELDLHFTPCSLREIKAKRAESRARAKASRKPWVVVANPGQADESVLRDFSTWEDAAKYLVSGVVTGDVMKRCADGTLTTEY